MSVEKRYSKRFQLHGDVYIRYRRQGVFPAKAEDCSQYGMSLRTQNLTLLSGALVELDIFFNNRNWQITGVVTHTRNNALGVMFWEAQPEFYSAVAEVAQQLSDGRSVELIAHPTDVSSAVESAQ